jgi:hypothetical protein
MFKMKSMIIEENKFQGVGQIKELRRTIIGLCLLILTLSGFRSLPESKYYDKNLKTLVKANEAQVIEVGKGMKIDRDTIYIKRIINTQDKTYVRCAFIRFEQGWSFPDGALKIFDDKGKEYLNRSGGWSGKLWGQDGLFEIERINKDSKYIAFKLDWYDRKNELTISLGKEGEINENK